MSTIDNVKAAIEELEEEKAISLVKECIAEGLDPHEILNQGVQAGVGAIGDRFQKGDYCIAELIMGGDLAKECISLLEPELAKSVKATAAKKKVVVGTVHGDIHSIGKDMVSLLLNVGGFEVYDLGIDVPTMKFIEKAEETKADVIALSSLMLVTMSGQAEVIKYLRDLGIRDKYKVMVGGGPTTQEWADQIGADGWARTASEAVGLAGKLAVGG